MLKKVTLLSYIFFLNSFLYAESYPNACFDKACEPAIRREISKAKTTIRLAVYSFTRFSLAASLTRAADKGLDVQVIVDKKQLKHDSSEKILKILKEGGVKVFIIDKKNKSSMHHKFLVLDSQVTITGSFNYTTSASKYNSENILIVKDKKISTLFEKEWLKLIVDL